MMMIQENVYLFRPLQETGPGVLVLHAWWGFNNFIRSFCDRLAGEGYITLAPDLYHGEIATTIPEAEKLRKKTRKSSIEVDVLKAANTLLNLPEIQGSPIGVIGFSLGAYWSLWLTEQEDIPVSLAIFFYGTRRGDYTKSHTAFLGHFAEHDPYESASGIAALKRSLVKAGKEVDFYTYPGTGHWFLESDRIESFNQNAADLAWERSIDKLHKYLSTKH